VLEFKTGVVGCEAPSGLAVVFVAIERSEQMGVLRCGELKTLSH
jgi:hypothetical protein